MNLDRFKRMQELRQKAQSYAFVEDIEVRRLANNFTYIPANVDLVNSMGKSLEQHYTIHTDFIISRDEAREFLLQFQRDYNDNLFNQFIKECKQCVISSVTGPFGLGGMIARKGLGKTIEVDMFGKKHAGDQEGGNVDTILNVRNGVYATTKVEERAESQKNYTHKELHQEEGYYKEMKAESFTRGETSYYINEYTGEKVTQQDFKKAQDLYEGNYNPWSPSREHIEATSKIIEDRAIALTGKDPNYYANRSDNLIIVPYYLNTVKSNKSMSEFLQQVDSLVPQKTQEIQQLREIARQNGGLTSEQQQEYEITQIELKQLKGVQKNKEQLLKMEKEAKATRDKQQRKDSWKNPENHLNNLKQSSLEGVKMGLQQALGMIIVEFFDALIDEFCDIYKNGYFNHNKEETFIGVLKERIQRIGRRLKEKWRIVAQAFKEGFISGFISNLVTTLISAFAKTTKNMVRIIREGIFSLFKAIKILLFPDKEMTLEDKWHEVKKILVSGAIVCAGVFIGESIDKMLMSVGIDKILMSVGIPSSILSEVIIGVLTGLVTAMAMCYLDKRRNDREAIQEMINQIHETNQKNIILVKSLQW